MSLELEKEIKRIEQELIDLKTASEYTSVRSANYKSVFRVTMGLYKITYASSGVFSIVRCSTDEGEWGSGNVYGRTPSANIQYVEVGHSDLLVAGADNYSVPFVILSNTPVVSIERVS